MSTRCERVVRGLAIAMAAGLTASACVSSGRLAEYDFRESTITVVTEIPPQPQVFTGPLFLPVEETPTLLNAILRVGSEVAMGLEARSARSKLSEAADHVDVADRMAYRVLERASRQLSADPVEDDREADFVLEVYVDQYGIDAESWHSDVEFFIKAQVYLLDGSTGEKIWETDVESSDRITPMQLHIGAVGRNTITAAALSRLSVEEMAVTFEGLADYAANRITDKLRKALDKVRG